MSLTVPTAGVTGGRAAEIQIEAPQTGAVLSQFGDVVKGLGDRLEADRLDLESGRLQLDMTRDLNQLRLKYAQMGDPDAIDRGWAADVAALKQGYMTGKTEAGRPRVDPKLSEQFGLMFDDLAERHAFAVGMDVVGLRRSQGAATRIEYDAVLSQSTATADQGTRETLYEQNDADLDRLVLQGVKTPEEAATEKLAARQSGDFNAFVTDMGKDVEGARAGLAAGSYGHMTPEDRVRAEAALAGADAKALALSEKVVADGLAAQRETAGEAIKLLKDGIPASGVTLLQDPAFVAAEPELAADLKGADWLFRNVPAINLMSEAQLTAKVEELSAGTFARNADADGLRMMRARLAEVREKKRTDPVGLWRDAGIQIGTIDFSAPVEDLGAALAQRAVDVKRMVKTGHMDKPVYFDANETAAIKERTASSADPGQRLDTALMLQGAFGEADPDLVGKITGDAALGGIAAMLDQGYGNETMARQILSGQRIAAENGLPLPSEGKWREIIGARFGGLFTDGTDGTRAADGSWVGAPDENAALRTMGEMAFGLYVWRKGKAADLDAEAIDPTALEQAFHEVAGGTGTFGDGDATGGIQIVRGVPTIVPPGMSGGDIEDAWRAFASSVTYHSDLSAAARDRPVGYAGLTPTVAGRDPDTLFRQVSPTGKVPRINGMPLDPQTMGNLHLRALGAGAEYQLVWTDPDNGDSFTVMGDDLTPYVMDLDLLLRVAGEAGR